MTRVTTKTGRRIQVRPVPPRAAGLAVLVSSAALMAAAAPAEAGKWTIDPFVGLEQQFTDNARSLKEPGEMDTITTLDAGINVRGHGARVNLNLDYRMSRDTYWDNSDLNGNRQNLLTQGDVELWENILFLDARAAMSDVTVSQSGAVTATDRTATSNRTRTLSASIAPTVRHHLGSWADTEFVYRLNEIRFFQSDAGDTDAGVPNSRIHELRSAVTSGDRFQRLHWQLNASTTINYSANEFRSRRDRMTASADYDISRHVSVIGTVGNDKVRDKTDSSDSNSGTSWSAGVELRPNQRGRLRVEYGRRFNTDSITGNLEYKFSQAINLSAAYTIDVTTQQEALANSLNNIVFDPLTGQFVDQTTGLPVDPNNLGTDLVDATLKTQRFSLGLNGTRGRNSFSVGADMTKRDIGTTGGRDQTTSLQATLARRLTPKTNGSVNGAYVRNTQSGGSDTQEQTIRAGANLDYNFSTSFTGSMNYRHLRRISSAGNGLTENVVSVRFRKNF